MIIAEEVQSKAQEREFLEFQARLYQHDPNYIKPLDKDIQEIFNPEKNKFFQMNKLSFLEEFLLLVKKLYHFF